MPRAILVSRITQLLIALNIIVQLLWVTHLSFPKAFVLTLEELEILLVCVMFIYILSSTFVLNYLYKKKYKFPLVADAVHLIFYVLILLLWYCLVRGWVGNKTYQFSYTFYLLACLIPGAALTFGRSKEMKWLRYAGIFSLAISFLNLGTNFLKPEETEYTFNYWRFFLNYINSFSAIFWIVHFQKEIMLFPVKDDQIIDID